MGGIHHIDFYQFNHFINPITDREGAELLIWSDVKVHPLQRLLPGPGHIIMTPVDTVPSYNNSRAQCSTIPVPYCTVTNCRSMIPFSFFFFFFFPLVDESARKEEMCESEYVPYHKSSRAHVKDFTG